MTYDSIGALLKHAWNAFFFRGTYGSQAQNDYQEVGTGSFTRPDRSRRYRNNEQSIVTAVYNRIAIDVASVSIRHVRVDDNEAYEEDVKSSLNERLTLEANIDQTGRALIQDIVMSMCDEGVVAVVPVETSVDPSTTGSYEIHSLRTGKIIEWFPQHVSVNLYNDRTGKREDVLLPKSTIAIIENPLYAIMNEPNGTLQRLIRKLNLLDVVDEQSSSGKLDLLIQLPYVIKSEARRNQAETRRKEIEVQLAGSKYGIAYIDGTERVTQLNRPAENNLMAQIQYLTSMLYGQLGITEEIMNGTADEGTMLNYMSRTIEPILSAIIDECKRKFLTKTARSQKQSIMFFTNFFRLVPAKNIAEIADRLTRNEIASSNEMRAVFGWKPSKDKRADELRNKNLNAPTEENTRLREEMLEQEVEELRIANEQSRREGKVDRKENSQNGRKN